MVVDSIEDARGGAMQNWIGVGQRDALVAAGAATTVEASTEPTKLGVEPDGDAPATKTAPPKSAQSVSTALGGPVVTAANGATGASGAL